jgi:phosphoenolpyruvate-protein phosphotransferase
MAHTTESPELELSGQSIAPGLALGRAWVIGDVLKWDGPLTAIGADEADGEFVRLSQAVDEALRDLEQHAQRIEAEFDSSLAAIFRAHGGMLRDLFASGEFERELRSSLVSAEVAVRRVLQRWHTKFAKLENQIIRQRADDVLDLGRSVIRRLRGESAEGLAAIPENSVLVAEYLLPSDIVTMSKIKVSAMVIEKLGHGSHAALLAREKSIPTISTIANVQCQVKNGEELLVDGFRGSLVVNPRVATRIEFDERLQKWRTTLVRCKAACRDPAKTLDGEWIKVEANIGVHDDVELALDNGADGVGLLRLEQLYFGRPSPPSEDELFDELQSVVKPFGARPVTIRLLDIGGDKPLPYLHLPVASNPALGRRGVRLLLDYAQLVRTQLGAILQLSQSHSVRVLIPMVTLQDDIRRMRDIFDSMVAERKVARPPEFGAMIETPAAALAVPALKQHVEFFCVGTNDLTQYTLAASRDDDLVNDYYLDGHESVLRLLRVILEDARERPVTLCGELAGREAYIPELLKMGFRGLSVAPNIIPSTKALIRQIDLRDAKS